MTRTFFWVLPSMVVLALAMAMGCVMIQGDSNSPILIMLNTTATIPLQLPVP